MIVINRERVLAVVIRHDGQRVTLVPMRRGKLTAQHLAVAEFNREWQPCAAPLAHTLETFQLHIASHGASREVASGLERLAARDQDVVASLF